MAESTRKNGRRTNGNGHSAEGLGERLRQARTHRGFSLRELARRLDVSPSLVSQIETGKIQPSVRTLYAIVTELGVSLDQVFPPKRQVGGAPADGLRSSLPLVADAAPRDPADYVQRGDERSRLDLESGVRWERLTVRNERDVEFIYTVYPPGSESAPADALVRHNGREFGLVLSGRLGVTVAFDEHVLEPGDSIFFESTIPHRLHNDGSEDVTAIWIVLGRRPNG
jgi:transcriptional regulator with XRE-family HTH domain